MSFIQIKKVKGHEYSRELESYQASDGKIRHRTLHYLGKERPKELNGVPLGFDCKKLFVGKRIQVRIIKLGLEEFIDQVGTIRKISKGKAGIEFDIVIKGRKEWTVPLEWLGNIPREQINEN